jgi:MarR family 2-MHQ and catechol resistance regulon transcriptional repressor
MTQVKFGYEVYRAISELARRYQFRNRDEVCCYGLTVSQCYALESLSQEEKLNSTQLATRLGLDLSTTTRVVDELAKKKLVFRRRGAEDARVKEITISDAGRRLIARVEEDFSKILGEAIEDFDPRIQQEIPKVLHRLASVLNCCTTERVAIPAASIRRV